ncbi:fimbrial protein [Paraburkholderia phymatum]|uniref:Fimbrial protein n=1 Tax=Paraburkholderia phymatum TaxID=148447 RepID=A0ACC6UAV1_9BURK
MKVKKSGLLIALIVAAGAALPTASFASDGTITISGNIVPQTCVPSGNGQGKDFTVTLPTVQVSALATDGATAGRTPFNIALTGCTPNIAGASNAGVYFEPGATVDTTTGQLINATGTATKVEVGLLNDDYSKINLGQGATSQNVKMVSISSGSATLNYYAQYVAKGGAAGAGTVQTTSLYTIIYQ